ncbi:MAG TPA: DUF4837 family protein [Bacteroidetes bacterium]|nr:DUF4837 family protein [Bacteroidota bacterium]
MKKLVFYLGIFLLAGLGCKTDNKTLKPKISGSTGEVLVVAPDYLWNSPAGDTLESSLTRELPCLPQPEPMFNIIHVTPVNFDKMFQTHRNILFMRIDKKKYPEAKILIEHDLWATPQLIMEMQAPDIPSFVKLVTEVSDSVVNRINEIERSRIISYYKKYLQGDIYNKLKEKYHISLNIPKGYTMDVDSANFAWISSETPTTSQGILIYFYPYTSEDVFTRDNLIKVRNRTLRKYVHGQIKGTYMTTETILPPEFRAFKRNGQYYAQLRGLWKLENGFMGGPFVSISTVDKYHGRVITVEGYVYAPGDKKRELLRQVESILYTLKIYPDR